MIKNGGDFNMNRFGGAYAFNIKTIQTELLRGECVQSTLANVKRSCYIPLITDGHLSLNGYIDGVFGMMSTFSCEIISTPPFAISSLLPLHKHLESFKTGKRADLKRTNDPKLLLSIISCMIIVAWIIEIVLFPTIVFYSVYYWTVIPVVLYYLFLHKIQKMKSQSKFVQYSKIVLSRDILPSCSRA